MIRLPLFIVFKDFAMTKFAGTGAEASRTECGHCRNPKAAARPLGQTAGDDGSSGPGRSI